jgi:hypothetical protein
MTKVQIATTGLLVIIAGLLAFIGVAVADIDSTIDNGFVVKIGDV